MHDHYTIDMITTQLTLFFSFLGAEAVGGAAARGRGAPAEPAPLRLRGGAQRPPPGKLCSSKLCSNVV